jgi:hypothetical protein
MKGKYISQESEKFKQESGYVTFFRPETQTEIQVSLIPMP